MVRDHAAQIAALLTFALFLGRTWMRHERAQQDVESAKAGLDLRQKQLRNATLTLILVLAIAYVIARVYINHTGS